jgi:hypothetical protein
MCRVLCLHNFDNNLAAVPDLVTADNSVAAVAAAEEHILYLAPCIAAGPVAGEHKRAAVLQAAAPYIPAVEFEVMKPHLVLETGLVYRIFHKTLSFRDLLYRNFHKIC